MSRIVSSVRDPFGPFASSAFYMLLYFFPIIGAYVQKMKLGNCNAL